MGTDITHVTDADQRCDTLTQLVIETKMSAMVTRSAPGISNTSWNATSEDRLQARMPSYPVKFTAGKTSFQMF